MNRILLFFVVAISFFSSCKKDSATPDTTKTVKYECKCTPLLGAVLTGGVTYTTPTSATNSATLTDNSWTLTQSNWNLKTGDKLTLSVSVVGNSTCLAGISINGALVDFKSQTVSISGQTPANNFTIVHTVQ